MTTQHLLSYVSRAFINLSTLSADGFRPARQTDRVAGSDLRPLGRADEFPSPAQDEEGTADTRPVLYFASLAEVRLIPTPEPQGRRGGVLRVAELRCGMQRRPLVLAQNQSTSGSRLWSRAGEGKWTRCHSYSSTVNQNLARVEVFWFHRCSGEYEMKVKVISKRTNA